MLDELRRSVGTRPLAAALFLSLLVSCAGGHDYAVLQEPVLGEDHGIVVFSVIAGARDSHGVALTREDTPSIDYSLSFGSTTALIAKQIAPILGVVGSADARGSVSGDMESPNFVVAKQLRSGEYSIYDVEVSLTGFNGGTFRAPIDLRFTSVANQITYIGTLRIDFISVWGLLGDQPARRVKATVIDDRDAVLAVLMEKNPSLGYEVETLLLHNAE